MKNNKGTVYCYEYLSNVDILISKLKVGRYYREYLIEFLNNRSFSVGVERLGHSSGRWYEATIEKNADRYLIKSKLVVLPKREETKLSIFEKVKLVLLYVVLSPLLILFGLVMTVSWCIKKIKKDPFATYNPEKRLDYFMINYLGCCKIDDSSKNGINKIIINLDRDSVCLGDDIDNHSKTIKVKVKKDVNFTILEIARGYLPKVAGKNHRWICKVEDVCLAEIYGNCEKILTITNNFSLKSVINMYFEYVSSKD